MEQWSSRIGFLLATIGSAVGIGNVWRFSSVMGQNGGGAYLIPYLLACFLFAVPLMVLELSAGRYFHGTVVSTLRKVGRYAHIIGWFIAGVISLILSYYLVITGWTLAYSWFALTGENITFSTFSGSSLPILFFVLSTLIVGTVVSRGVKKGIERLNIVLVPFIFLILVGMVFYASSLTGFQEGLTYLFRPDFTILTNPFIWSAALGQAFFSLSVGQGILLTYGSYTGGNVNIPRSSMIITLADISVSLLSGLVIFPVVFTFGLTPAIGAELAFSTLPRAFEMMPLGRVFALAFFLLLFFAALTSAISMLEVPAAAVMESSGWERKRVIAVLIVLLLLVGLPSALSYSGFGFRLQGIRWLDLMDDTAGTLGLILTAILMSISFSWFLKKTQFSALMGDATFVSLLIRPLTRYLIPGVLVFALGLRFYRDIAASNLLYGADITDMTFLLLMPILLFGSLIVVTILLCYLRQCKWSPWKRPR